MKAAPSSCTFISVFEEVLFPYNMYMVVMNKRAS
jgi:hypothetical protein